MQFCIFNLVPAIVLSLFTEYFVFVRVLRPLLFAKDGSLDANDAEDCKTGSSCFFVLLALYLSVALCVACIFCPDEYTVCVGNSWRVWIMPTVPRCNTRSSQSSRGSWQVLLGFCLVLYFCCFVICF